MRILFLGTHGQKNWGDELLLKTFMERLSPLADTLYVNSYDPSATAEYLQDYNVHVFHTSTDRFKLLWYLLKSDALVFGGGSVLKELYTAYGGERYATLRVIDTLTRAAALLGKPIYFCNIGVGPVQTEQGMAMVQRIVNRAAGTTVRDGESLALLQKADIGTPYELSSDIVFSVDRTELGLSAKKWPGPGKKSSKKSQDYLLGINLCRNIQNNANWHYFVSQLTRDLVAWCSKHPKTRLLGIPMQANVSNNNDAAELIKLSDAVHQKLPDVEFKVLEPSCIEDIAAAINRCDAILAERLHTLILATIIGTPLVALEYDIKVASIMKDVGLDEYGLDINKRFAPFSILRLLQKATLHPEATRIDLSTAYTYGHFTSTTSFQELTGRLSAVGQEA
jgi:polysaccharide pyruvyl transferase WcaK-like protein